jgi:hypothetical protein
MRWKLPKNYEYRNRRKFAWLPIIIDGEKIWLEFYTVRQYYVVSIDKWFDEKWIKH